MNTTTKQTPIIYITLAALLIIGGIILLGYCLHNIPVLKPDHSFSWTIAGSILSFIPIVFGGMWLGLLLNHSKPRYRHSGLGNGFIFGFLLIATGATLLCFNTGILPPIWKPVFISWQMLLILIGFIEICKFHFISGFTMIIIGKFFIIPKLAYIYPDNWLINENFVSNYWPVLMILFGIIVVLALVIKPKYFSFKSDEPFHHNYVREDINGEINHKFIFSGTEQVFLDPEFKGGNIDILFGGMTLDLRKTFLPEGVTYLKIDSFFGGVTILVPENWEIEIRTQAILGGFTDNRIRTGETILSDRKLIIVANCMLGGGEIK